MKRILLPSDFPSYIQDLLSDGCNHSSVLCPVCSGGRTGELSASVYNDGPTAAIKCHRAGCGYYSTVMLDPTYRRPEAFMPPKFHPKVCKHELYSILEGDSPGIYLRHRYGVERDTLTRFGVKHVHGKKAVYMPVYDMVGFERGGTIRYFDGSEPKAVAYKHTDKPWQAWYVHDHHSAPLVIVEDQLSAMRAWQIGYNAVALLGTNLNTRCMDEIAEWARGRKILLALDNDAFRKAINYAKRYQHYGVKPVLLARDLKDDTDYHIRATLG